MKKAVTVKTKTEKRTCGKCEQAKPLTAEHFHKDNSAFGKKYRKGFQHVCKECRSRGMKEYYKTKKKKMNIDISVLKIICKQCNSDEKLADANLKFQKDPKSKTGFRQPCKSCIKLNRKVKPPRNEAAKA